MKILILLYILLNKWLVFVSLHIVYSYVHPKLIKFEDDKEISTDLQVKEKGRKNPFLQVCPGVAEPSHFELHV